MSDTFYRVRKYITFTTQELIAIFLTSVVAGLAVSMRDLLFLHYGEGAAVFRCIATIVFIFCAIIITVWLGKVLGARLGYVIKYRAHMPGLVVGIIISFMTQGFLPIFLPGGYTYEQPDRMRVGKWRPLQKGWETGVLAASFPLILLLFLLFLNPLYIAAQAEVFILFMVGICLLAVYSLIPFPFFSHTQGERATEIYQHFRGCTFGLDILWASKYWYVILMITVLFYALITWLMTTLVIPINIILYFFSFFFALLCSWIYTKFFDH